MKISCFDKVKNKSLLALKEEFDKRVPEGTDLPESEQYIIGKSIVLAHYDNLIDRYNDLRTRIDPKLPAIPRRPELTKALKEIQNLFSGLINKEIENGPDLFTPQSERSTEVIISRSEAAINKGQAAKTEEEVDDALEKVEAVINEVQSKIGKLTESWSTEDIQHETPSKVIGKQVKKEITKYAKEVARINGWEIPKVTNAIYDNIAPAGGDVVFHLDIPGTPYRMYVAAKYEPDMVAGGVYEDYAFNGFFYRLEEPTAKGNKYKGANQWQHENISAKEMAEILQTEVNKYISQSKIAIPISQEKEIKSLTGKKIFIGDYSGTVTFASIKDGKYELHDEKGEIKNVHFENGKLVDENNIPVTTKEEKRIIRDEKLKKDIDDAADEFMKGGNLMTSGGIDPVKIEKGVKLIGLYMKAGVYKFSDIIEDLHERWGDKVKDFFEELAGVYSYYYNTKATEQEANQMDPNLRGITFDNILNDIKNDRSTTNDIITSMEQGPSGVVGNRTPINVQGNEGGPNAGLVDSEQGAVGNNIPGQNGRERDTLEPGTRISNGNADVALNGNQQLDEELGGEAQDQPIPAPAEQKPVVSELQHNSNFVIPLDFTNTKSFNVAQKLQDNIDALKVLISLKNEKRRATYEEQKALFKYVGWGGIKEITFDPKSNLSWTSSNLALRSKIQEAHDVIKELDEENYKTNLDAVKRSIQNAHYTAIPVIRGIYNILKNAGFKGGNIVEPSAGIGHFIGAMPRDIADNSKVTAIELENITGQILKALYPNVSSKISGYQDVQIAPGTADLLISNIPFGKVAVTDINFEKGKDTVLKASQKFVHKYFFARAMQDVKPNGIISFVTTTGILDSPINQDLRDMMADRTEFLGAIRLPNDSFRGNANTQVTTDIIFLRKFAEGEEKKQSHSFQVIKSTQLKHKDKDQMFNVSYNEYFHDNPDMVLGEVAVFSMYGQSENSDDITVLPTGINIEDGISNLADKIFKNKIVEAEQKEKNKELAEDLQQFVQNEGQRPGNIVEITPGEYGIYSDELAINEELDAKARAVGINPDKIRNHELLPDELDWLKQQTGLTEKDFQIKKVTPVKIAKKYQKAVKDLFPLRKSLNELYAAEYGDYEADAIEHYRSLLNKSYKTFVKNNGTLLSNKPLIDIDIDGYNLLALENVEDKKIVGLADIFTKRVFEKAKRAESAQDIHEAIAINLNETGSLDLDRMAELLKKTPDQIIEEGKGLIYKNPVTGDFETKDKYLSGNVRKKLNEAKISAATDKFYDDNVTALEAAQPQDLNASQIYAPISAPWISAKYLNQFASHIFKQNVSITKLSTGRVSVSGNQLNTAVDDVYGTTRMTGFEILGEAIQNRMPIVKDTFKGPPQTTVVNEKATKEANDKVNKIRQDFDNWIWQDDDRRNELVAYYNQNYNNTVTRKYDGSQLTFPGYAGEHTPKSHQLDGVWMILQQMGGIIDHIVGSGKAQPLTAKILTPTGWKLMGDIKVGNMAISADGKPTKITGVFPQGTKDIYEVVFSDGSKTQCCDEHLWLTSTYSERNYQGMMKHTNKNWECAKPKVRQLSEIRKTLIADHLGALNHSIPIVDTVEFESQPVLINPYLLGLLIGDGSLNYCIALTTSDTWIANYIADLLPHGITIKKGKDDLLYTFPQIKKKGFGANQQKNILKERIKKLGLNHTSYFKFIPEQYKFNAVDVRLQVLRGLMDADGTVGKTGKSVVFNSVSKKLIDDVSFIVRSLGGTTGNVVSKMGKYKKNGEVVSTRMNYHIAIKMPPGINPFLLPRKADLVVCKTKYKPVRYITEVNFIGKQKAQCISVANPSHLYVTDDFIVTHNTLLMALAAHKGKEMGLFNKPIITGLKANTADLARAYMSAFPMGKVLSPKEKDFTPQNRRAFFAKIANNNWDLIVMTHDQFGKIEQPKEIQQEIIQQEIDALENDIRIAKDHDLSKRELNGLEQRKQNLEDRLTKLSLMSKDPYLKSFDEMGIDFMFVDESQQFKNLAYNTIQRGISGLGSPKGSAKAFNMLFAIRYLQKMYGADKGTTFASGTPISNTMVEMYSLFKYLRPNKLLEMGINSFDQWANTFARVGSEIEFGVTNSLKPKVRMREFMNVPEMSTMYREITDVRNDSNLKLEKPVPKQTFRVKTDKEIVANEKVTIEGNPFKVIGRIKGIEKNEYWISLMSEGNDDWTVPNSGVLVHAGHKINYSEGERSDGLLVNIAPTLEQRKFAKKIQKFAETKDGSYIGIRMTDNMKKSYMLLATGLAAKMAIDMKLINPSYAGTEVGKLGVAADYITHHYNESNALKGIQLVFSDLGTPKAASTRANLFDLLESRGVDREILENIFGAGAFSDKQNFPPLEKIRDKILSELEYSEAEFEEAVNEANEDTFNIYEELKNKLIKRGIPSEEIVFIHDYKSDVARAQMFEDARNGKIRVIIGSTSKLGTGVNVQNKVVAGHHLDVPWRPSDMEQRNGRYIRQGNFIIRDHYNNKIPIYYYATEATLDAYKYQLLDAKQKFINQAKTGEGATREISEGDGDEENGVSFAAMTAMLSGNPILLEKAKIDRKVKDLDASKKSFEQEKYSLKDKISWSKREMESTQKQISELEKDKKLFEENSEKDQKTGEWRYKITIGDEEFTERKKAGDKLLDVRKDYIKDFVERFPETLKLKKKEWNLVRSDSRVIGKISGFNVSINMDAREGDKGVQLTPYFSITSPVSNVPYGKSWSTDPVSLAGHFQREIRNQQPDIDRKNNWIREYTKDIKDKQAYLESLPEAFPKQKELEDAVANQMRLSALLDELAKAKPVPTAEELEALGEREDFPNEFELENLYALSPDGQVFRITSDQDIANALNLKTVGAFSNLVGLAKQDGFVFYNYKEEEKPESPDDETGEPEFAVSGTTSEEIQEMQDVVKEQIDLGNNRLADIQSLVATELEDDSPEMRQLVKEAYDEYGRGEDTPFAIVMSVIDRIESNLNAINGNGVDILTNTQTLKDKAEELGNVQYQFAPEGKILGFTHGGKIYLNGKHLNPNTPIHENGHLWLNWAEQNKPEIYNRGIELVSGSAYLDKVKSNTFYQLQASKLAESEREKFYQHEALAMVIGDKGAQFVTEAKKEGVAAWLKQLWNAIKNALGFENITSAELQNLTFEQFAERAVVDILKEREQEEAADEEEKEQQDWEDRDPIADYAMTTTGEVKNMLSGANITQNLGYAPEGDQSYLTQRRVEMLQDGKNMIGAAMGKWGTDLADYGQPLFNYIKNMSGDEELFAKKAVLMATFLGEIREEINRNPDRADELRGLDNAVTKYYQDYMNKRGKEVSAGALLRLYRDKYMGDIFANQILEENEIKDQNTLRKLQTEQADIEARVQAGIEEFKRVTQQEKDAAEAEEAEKKIQNVKAKQNKKAMSPVEAQKTAAAKAEELAKKGGLQAAIDKIKNFIDKCK